MDEILRCKLAQHQIVNDILIEQKDLDIVEMNDNDGFWGWGADHEGDNNLGKAWMRLRDEIRVNA